MKTTSCLRTVMLVLAEVDRPIMYRKDLKVE